jgi:hypothetical protein
MVKMAARVNAIARMNFTFSGRDEGEGICVVVDKSEGAVAA